MRLIRQFAWNKEVLLGQFSFRFSARQVLWHGPMAPELSVTATTTFGSDVDFTLCSGDIRQVTAGFKVLELTPPLEIGAEGTDLITMAEAWELMNSDDATAIIYIQNGAPILKLNSRPFPLPLSGVRELVLTLEHMVEVIEDLPVPEGFGSGTG